MVSIMRLVISLLIAASAMLVACGTDRPAELEKAFPDLRTLVTTSDPLGVRRLLGTSAATNQGQHTEELLALLREASEIDAAHLVLLARAVPLPVASSVSIGSDVWTYPLRGQAPNSALVDQLLAEGAEKVREIDSYWFGEMVGISQSDATMVMLCERFGADVDDGSEHAMMEMLRGMTGSPALVPFVRHYIPSRGMDTDRAWLILKKCRDTDLQMVLLELLLKADPEVTHGRAIELLQPFRFDDDRARAFRVIAASMNSMLPLTVYEVVKLFQFDEGRSTIIELVSKFESIELDEGDLIRLVDLFRFDDGRSEVVSRLGGSVSGPMTFDGATRLLEEFRSDDGRLKAVEALAPKFAGLSADQRSELLECFSFPDSKLKAVRFLMR